MNIQNIDDLSWKKTGLEINFHRLNFVHVKSLPVSISILIFYFTIWVTWWMINCHYWSLNFADRVYKRTSVKRMNELDTIKALADTPHFIYPLLPQFSLYPTLVVEIAQFWLLWSALTLPKCSKTWKVCVFSLYFIRLSLVTSLYP